MVSSRPTGFQHSNVKWCLPGLPGKPWGASLLFPYSKFPKAFKGSLPLVPPQLGLSHGSLTICSSLRHFQNSFILRPGRRHSQGCTTVWNNAQNQNMILKKNVQHSNLKRPGAHKNNVQPTCVPPLSGPSKRPPGVARPQTPVEQQIWGEGQASPNPKMNNE